MVECAYKQSGNMSVDVMYQPYAPYFPYHHHQLSASAEHFKVSFCVYTLPLIGVNTVCIHHYIMTLRIANFR